MKIAEHILVEGHEADGSPAELAFARWLLERELERRGIVLERPGCEPEAIRATDRPVLRLIPGGER